MNKRLLVSIILIFSFSLLTDSHAKATKVGSPLEISPKKTRYKHIKSVEPIEITASCSAAPSLPYQVWVTYSDGSHEWRQVMWTNSSLTTENEEANPGLYPEGKEYKILGYIIGDNTSNKGFPVTANIKVSKDAWNEVKKDIVATAFPLTDVTITGHNRLTNNRDLDIKALLELDVTQQLYNYRDTYGLPTEGYKEADGWDSPTTKLKGHGTGHYMSALAFAFASTQNKTQKAELFYRMERVIKELRECQERTFVWDSTLNRYWEARDYAPANELVNMKGTWEAFDEYKKDYKHYGYGYLNAIPAAHPALIECYRAYNNEDWVWAPYYTIHKQLAGLIDIANVLCSIDNNDTSLSNIDLGKDRHMCPNEVGRLSYLIAKDMGLWVWNRLHYRSYLRHHGTKAERQERPGNRYEMWNMYIAGEVGGIEESLARLSEMADDTQDKERLLEAAKYFDAPAFFIPVARNIDDIRSRHANQHIPMITGALRTYASCKNPFYYNLARNFWNMIQGRYSYATGGVGNGEMFRQPYSQILSMNTSVYSDMKNNMYPNPDINETCCAYNLAKLTKDLNCFDPDNAEYMDYYERVLYNQIVGSVHPSHWGVTYQYAVGMNATKPYGNETPQSTCCGGTGMESHVKYQEATYFSNDSTLWVGLYMPSVLNWKSKGVSIQQDCDWPAEYSTIKIAQGKGSFAMKLRVPYWATSGFDVKLNGKSIAKRYKPCSYITIPERVWSTEDVVEVIMPFTKHINWGPDKMALAATGKNEIHTPFNPQWTGVIMYGPLAMATPDVKTWKEADFNITANLDEITVNSEVGTDGTGGKLYSLSLDGKTFTPDYYQTSHSTHYLRLNIISKTKKKVSKSLDMSSFKESIAIAHQRKTEQEAWNALAEKVPSYAPWAPNGYARLIKMLDDAEKYTVENKEQNQDEIDELTSNLNMAINTMRPGNLAEPEDLNDLIQLLTYIRTIPNKSDEIREAMNYANMVMEYVNNGSGTQDLIQKATNNLREVLKSRKKK